MLLFAYCDHISLKQVLVEIVSHHFDMSLLSYNFHMSSKELSSLSLIFICPLMFVDIEQLLRTPKKTHNIDPTPLRTHEPQLRNIQMNSKPAGELLKHWRKESYSILRVCCLRYGHSAKWLYIATRRLIRVHTTVRATIYTARSN